MSIANVFSVLRCGLIDIEYAAVDIVAAVFARTIEHCAFQHNCIVITAATFNWQEWQQHRFVQFSSKHWD